MKRLFKVELKKLFKRFEVRTGILVSLLFGVIINMIGALNDDLPLEGFFDFCIFMLPIFAGITGLFVSRGYTQNTIRNKLIVGHSRIAVYMSMQAVVTIAYILFFVFYYVSGIIVTYCMYDDMGMVSKKALAYSFILLLFAYIAMASITCFLAMNVQGIVGGVLPLGAVYTMTIFSVIEEIIDNETLKKIINLIPTGQIIKLSPYVVTSDIGQKIGASVAFFAVFMVLGYGLFSRADIS